MILIGMLHHRKSPYKIRKAYAYAAVAKAEGTELLYFSPKKVNFDTKKINGYIYKNGKWVQISSRFPDVIYNAGSPEVLNHSIKIIKKLKKEIPFTTHSIGNKIIVHNRLFKDGEFSKYLIPSQIIYSQRQFMQFFMRYHKVVLKPVNGHKGQGITLIEKVKDDYFVQILSEKKILTHKELLRFINLKIREELYLVQQYINSKTKSGNSYDFRLHTQKNEVGEWVITAIYPRIGPSGSIVSNISSGGFTNYLEPFLKQEFGDNYFNIKRYLEHFSLQLAKKMDDIQLKNYNETIDELGIDVGLDESKKIWIYEINWRPGCPPAFYLELDVVKNMIKYAVYLASYKQKKK